MGRLLGLPDRHGAEDIPAAGAAPGTYEFNQLQNHTFSELAKAMRFVGVFTGIAGAVYGVIALFALMHGNALGAIIGIVEAVIGIVLGSYLIAAAANCRRVVETQGSDIPNLMAALDQLRRYFVLQMVLIIIALVLIGAGVLLFIVA
jgi:hypothetical protein